MTKDSLSALPLWDRFQKAAWERGRSPVRLLTDYMRERLEIWEDQQQIFRHSYTNFGYREQGFPRFLPVALSQGMAL